MKKYVCAFLIFFGVFTGCTNAQNVNDPEYKYNERVVSQLVKAGDNLSKPRKVQHWIYFAYDNDRKEFIKDIQEKGYGIDTVNYLAQDKFPYSVTISKINPVTIEAMIPVTKELKVIAKKYNGDYDGWETSVEK